MTLVCKRISPSVRLPLNDGDFLASVWSDSETESSLVLLEKGEVRNHQITPVVRIHSACMTGDVFGSMRCDCGQQLKLALRIIRDAPCGFLLYELSHEGRGIGLAAKLKAYELQDHGLDTFAANVRLGFPADGRDYSLVIAVLRQLAVKRATLLTRNPFKAQALRSAGIAIELIRPLDVEPTATSSVYLADKHRFFSGAFESDGKSLLGVHE